MSDRTGSSSSFPTSRDQFVIKKSYNSSIALGQQEINSLEQASHFNHMFDAVFNIENHILSGSGGAGGTVVTRWASGVTNSNTDVYGSNVKLGYTALTASMTGNTITVTGMVPSSFGADPFRLNGFAMAHNLYLTNPTGANTEGVWANKEWTGVQPFNTMMTWLQMFTLVRPITGRQFEVTVKNIPLHSTSQNIDPTFTDNMKLLTGAEFQHIWERPGWSGGGYRSLTAQATIGGICTWAGLSEERNDARYGWAYPTKLASMTDSYVEWGEILEHYTTFTIETGECFTRVGPMVRAQGSITNASFYCIAIGDVPAGSVTPAGDPGLHGRLLKVSGANLSNEGPATTSGGGVTWPSGTVNYISGGGTSSSGYLWFGERSTRYRLKCETVPGSAKITVQSSPSPYSVWSTLYGPYYDGVSPIASGYSGVFSQAMNGDSTRYVKFLGSVVVGNLNSDTSVPIEVQLMFVQVGPESNMTMEVG